MDSIWVAFCVLLGLITWSEAKLVHFHQTYPRGSGNEVQYDFAYAIDDAASGLVTDRWEEKRGGVVKGAYSLLEPGGNVRTVDYQVDGGGGFKAIVRTRRPGHYFLSTQEFHKSNQLHPQPSPELEIPQQSLAQSTKDDVPVNYHAINAQILGFQKLFGKNSAGQSFVPNNGGTTNSRQPLRLYRF